jgi:tripartite-type tricarboxylate transporter receptor subunit TctC
MIYMLARRTILCGVAAAFGAPLSVAFAETYPSRTIKIIVPTPAGGPVDTMARLVANALPSILGQPVVIENRAGAGNTLGSKAAAIADPDGYTLSYTAASGLIMSPMLYKSAGYTAADFAPIAIVSETPQVFVANPNAPFKTVAELVAYAKANPGKLNYSTGGAGTLPHLTAELFKKLTGTEIVHVPYKGGGPALADVVGGQIHMTFDTLGQIPEVPAMPELGYPTIVTGAWTALLAPKAIPPEIVARLNQATNEALQSKPMLEAMERLGSEPRGGAPEELAAVIKADTEKWAPIVQSLGLKGD